MLPEIYERPTVTFPLFDYLISTHFHVFIIFMLYFSFKLLNLALHFILGVELVLQHLEDGDESEIEGIWDDEMDNITNESVAVRSLRHS